MDILEKYLKKIDEENESVGGFAIDSFPDHRDKKKSLVRSVYPESKKEKSKKTKK